MRRTTYLNLFMPDAEDFDSLTQWDPNFQAIDSHKHRGLNYAGAGTYDTPKIELDGSGSPGVAGANQGVTGVLPVANGGFGNSTGVYSGSSITPPAITLNGDGQSLSVTPGAVTIGTSFTNYYANKFNATTLSAASAKVVAYAYGMWVEPPAAGSNVTLTNAYAAGFNGSVYVTSALFFGGTVATVAGTVSVGPVNGLVLWGKTGSTNDLVLRNNAGTNVLAIPTGTSNVTLAGTLTTASGITVQSNGVAVTGNSTFTAVGNVGVTINAAANQYGLRVTGNSTTNQSLGLYVTAGTSSSDFALDVRNYANTVLFRVRGDGYILFGSTGSVYYDINGVYTQQVTLTPVASANAIGASIYMRRQTNVTTNTYENAVLDLTWDAYQGSGTNAWDNDVNFTLGLRAPNATNVTVRRFNDLFIETASNQIGTGAFTNRAHIYIGGLVQSFTGNYAIYSTSTLASVLAGALTVTTLTAPSVVVGVSGLTFNGDATPSGPAIARNLDGLLLVAGATQGVRINNSANSTQLWQVTNTGQLTSGSSGATTAYTATFGSGVTDANTSLLVGVGGGAPSAARTTLLQLHAPHGGSGVGSAYTQLLRAGTTIWQYGIGTQTSNGPVQSNTDLYWYEGVGGNYRMALTTSGSLVTAQAITALLGGFYSGASGTSSVPAFSFSGQTNVGMYLVSAGMVGIAGNLRLQNQFETNYSGGSVHPLVGYVPNTTSVYGLVAKTLDSNHIVALLPYASASAYNNLVSAGDSLLTWGGSAADVGLGNLIISPWSVYNRGIKISATGVITGYGNGVAGTLAPRPTIPADAFKCLSANSATLVPITTGADKYELQFPNGANTIHADIVISVPSNYAGGGLTITIYWLITGASQQVRWEVLRLDSAVGGDPDGSPTSMWSSNATSNGTSLRLTITTVTVASPSLTAGDLLTLRFQRVPTDAWDTSTATAQLRAVAIEFGSN